MFKYIKRFVHDLKKYKHYILYSVKSNLKAELSNTILGYVWWLLDPLLNMLIYTFVVQIIFKRADFAFPVYLFCALLPWKVATNTMVRSTSCVRDNAGIIKQVYIPHFIFSLVIFITNSIKLLFGFIILFAMIMVYKIPISWHYIEIFPIYLVFFLFYWSLSLFLTHFGVLFDDMRNLIAYVIMFWFYASPSMWYLDMLPEKLKGLIWFNPNTAFFNSMRNIFMWNKSPDYKWLGIWAVFSVITLLFGIILIYRSEKNYSKVI